MRSRGSVLGRVGLIAGVALVVGPSLAWLRVVPGLAGFVVFALGGVVSVLVGIASVVQALRGRGITPGGSVALVAGLAFVVIASRGRGAPPINDFTTDLADPPAFQQAVALPANAGRDMSYPRAFAPIQQACCADLRPARLRLPPAQAFARALTVAERMPAWTITRDDASAGVIEATATTRLFGFHDDVVIRVRPEGDGGSRVDVRSKSRDGKGDIGANAARIRAFVTSVEASS